MALIGNSTIAFDSIDALLRWAEPRPWARAMASCGQDLGWHAEGDVWTHTRMVVEELGRLPDWPTLDPEARAEIALAALFHDAGKPATTRVDPETGRTHAPKHAPMSMKIARDILRELGVGLRLRERIANLVRYHGRPAHLLERPEPSHEVIGLSWLVDHRQLHRLALADTRGRSTREEARPEEVLDLWMLVAEENGCADRPYPFADDHARFRFFDGDAAALYDRRPKTRRGTVTMMSGLPGAGKDSWLASNRPELPVVSLDTVRDDLNVDPEDDQGRVVQEARERCRVHLRDGRDFAFNATNTMARTRKRWIDLFDSYGARVELVYLEPPLPVLFDRNARRPRPIPRRAIEHLIDRLEPPSAVEAHGLTLLAEPGPP